MRLYALILLFGAFTTIYADPDPKKYKADTKEKNKHTNATLTSDEKKFLRDVEAKFGIEDVSPKEGKKEGLIQRSNGPPLGHFPAVIAIEIVNDTDTKSKGKRTIDANLGYGYKTNNGYTYSYFGKPSQEKGKFMIYPYSQEDIPAGGGVQSFHTVHHYEKPNGKHIKTSVEIQPSQAFELVPVKDQKSGTNYHKPSSDIKSHSTSAISHGYTTSSFTSHPSTLYTTYNGQQFTGLSGQFPSVMSNYLVDPSQLIKNPEYQSVGLTQDHLQSSNIEQKVVPVLVLRIPSSSLSNPSAELYANLPQNYPLSNYLNNLNLQQLVNQYFKKIGYNTGPQVMTYSSPLSSISDDDSADSSMSQHDHYAHPHVQPSYTQSHSSGIQYSAVQPVMAKYPPSYSRHHYSQPENGNPYKQATLPKYEYQYVPQGAVSSQNYFVPSTHYQHQTDHAAAENGHESSAQGSTHDHGSHVHYEGPGHLTTSYETSITHDTAYAAPQEHSGVEYTSQQGGATYDMVSQVQDSDEYGPPQAHVQYETSNGAQEYGVPKDESSQSLPAGYTSSISDSPSSYESPKEAQEYYTQNTHQEQQEPISVYPSQDINSQSQGDLTAYQTYIYHPQQASDDQGLILTENYPSKDHTIATVLPAHYGNNAAKQNSVQTVSYVTPMPHSKYKIPYQIMVPQTYLQNPSTEKVAYVHSQPMVDAEHSGYHYMQPAGKPKPTHMRNYHSHPKRMVTKHMKSRRPVPKSKRSRHEKKRP